MPTGYVFKDGGPIPDDELKRSGRTDETTAPPPNLSSRAGRASTDAPTDSHALAEADHDGKGAIERQHDESEVQDLGWNEQGKTPKPLVDGLQNDQLWLLLRRFNKQVYHVKATPVAPLDGLDLNSANQENFSPDKLHGDLERLYVTVIVGVIALGKHIVRLRSWKEPRRTSAFAAVYLLAWMLDLVVPLLVGTAIVLIVYPPARSFMFPPAPLALVNSTTGGIQSPQAGTLGSHDSVTGAPERYQGEAVEQEASNLVSGLASVASNSAAGELEGEEDPEAKSSADQSKLTHLQNYVKKTVKTEPNDAARDKTKEPMEDVMWEKLRPILRLVARIGEISDGWERFQNALSPTPPFPQNAPRLRLAAVLVPMLAVSLVTTSAMFVKTTTLLVGVGFFSDPLLWRALHFLNQTFPNWQKLLELRNNILKGVPTNAQLTITLLRMGETRKAPLPPPPRSDKAPPDRAASLSKDQMNLDATDGEVRDAIHPDPLQRSEAAPDTKQKAGAKVLGFIKTVTKGGVDAKFGTDRIRAAVGSEHARDHLGILPPSEDVAKSGPVDFQARYKGKKGWVYINSSATIPCVAFSTHVSDGTGEQTTGELKPAFSVPVTEIRELRKIGGLGFKAKLVVGWAADQPIADGLEIVTKSGETWKLTAIPLREELFNRLVAMGGQKWESL